MSTLALVGGIMMFVKEETLQKLLAPFVALSAGSLLGGAFLFMLPAALKTQSQPLEIFLWLLAGFTTFFALEQFLHWHHGHKKNAKCRKPLTYLILIGDALHNFLGGFAIAGVFLLDIRLGIMTWLAAAAHEIPQEIGDFSVLVYGGWTKKKALLYNFISASTFLFGGILAYGLSHQLDLTLLIPFAAGNFIYIGASDLIPELKNHTDWKTNLIYFLCFLGGLCLIFSIKLLLD
ncbi:MAG: ZIP family metal transporter [Deltaproteobacteria bacterium]|nr:ZIP family metal transporter [Deltaproteobacteria bacterium]